MKAKKKALLGCYAGLDLSLAGTGGVLLDENGDVVSILAFSTSKKEVEKARGGRDMLVLSPEVKKGDARAMWRRTIFVHDVIKEWLGMWAETGCLAAIEDHAFGARGTSIYQLGHLHGLVRHALHARGMRWLLVAPTELKAAVTGKGNADKKAMMSVETPGLDQKAFGATTCNNVVDAYWLARCVHAWSEVSNGQLKLSDIPFSMAAVMQPHAKRKGLLGREMLP